MIYRIFNRYKPFRDYIQKDYLQSWPRVLHGFDTKRPFYYANSSHMIKRARYAYG
jgi:hypothetical protein